MRKFTVFTTFVLLPLPACDPEFWTPGPDDTGSATSPWTETVGGDESGGDECSDPPNDLELCEASCEMELSCFYEGPGGDFADCVDACLFNLDASEDDDAFGGDAACQQAMRDYTTCLAEATSCSPECLQPTVETLFACEEQNSIACSSYSNGLPGPDCSRGESCEFQGGALLREFICEGETCVCLENGEEIASCEVDACQGLPVVLEDLWSENAQACCGWSDES